MPQISAGRLGQVSRFLNGEVGDLEVGHVVALDKDHPGKVVRADASDVTKMPAIGFAVALRGEVVAVQTVGFISVTEDILDSEEEIVMNAIYWVHPTSPGILTRVGPEKENFPDGGVIQPVALGRDLPRTLHIFVEQMGIEI